MPVTPRDLFVRLPEPGSPGRTYIPAEGGRAKLKRNTSWKTITSHVSVTRTGGVGPKSFEACVRIGGLRPGRVPTGGKTTSGFAVACMFGKNPREALSSALSRAARQFKKRSGAFARYR